MGYSPRGREESDTTERLIQLLLLFGILIAFCCLPPLNLWIRTKRRGLGRGQGEQISIPG